MSVPAGRAVVTEGEAGDRFYVVAHGRLEVTHGSDVVREARRRGLVRGSWRCCAPGPRTATVTAITAVSLYSLGRDAFLSAVAGVPRAVDVAADHARDHYR